MDALLPSEIARLVLGYLQDQKCDEAARIFIETSPLLQECRLVAQRGGRYTTKVGGVSLTEILDKYCAANVMVKEKLNKVSDSEQLKQCNDILEQLGYLLEGSRKRFVVNINYSSQNSPVGHFGTPNVSGSLKKRRGDSEGRSKRVARSLNTLIDKTSQNQINQDCDIVEATELDGLINREKSSMELVSVENKKFFNNQQSSVNSKETKVSTLLNVNSDVNVEVTSSDIVSTNYKDQATETFQVTESIKNVNKCTAETSTEELTNYCNTEVQTGFDLFDTVLDINSEPIQNISILTKELINSTELQQRIAENINKAILPIESSYRENDPNSSVMDLNKSKLSDLDDVIKTAVKATESDLEGILREIFDVNEQDVQPEINTGLKYDSVPETMDIDHGRDFQQYVQELPESVQNHQELIGTSELSIKQRLRSSSKSFNVDEDVRDSNALIDDQNAEAVKNIMNCIASKRNSLTDSEPKDSEPMSENNDEMNNMEVPKVASTGISSSNTECTDKKSKSKKTNTKKKNAKNTDEKKNRQPRKKYLKKSKKIVQEEGVPTIVICAESMPIKNSYVPIAPKQGEPPPSSDSEEAPILSYRVVNVPRHLVKPEQIVMSKLSDNIVKKTLEDYQTTCQTSSENDSIMPIVVQSIEPSELPPGEVITLYSSQENDNAEVATVPSIADMPIINLDSSTLADSGLSPFFKKSTPSDEPEVNIVVLADTGDMEQMPDTQKDVSKEENEMPKEHVNVDKLIEVTNEPELTDKLDPTAKLRCDELIVKRTPNTLLRSRSKNNRLSLSTPRRRNSHVRALDFGTPVKPSVVSKKGTQSCIKPSICRASLFKSPTYENTEDLNMVKIMTAKKKVRTLPPVKSSATIDLMNVPIATRSPAPKLRGNWNKVAGIGMILNESSTGESSPEKSQPENSTPRSLASPSFTPPKAATEEKVDNVLQKSWDSDLRKIVGNSADEEEEKTKPKSKKKSERKTIKVKTKNKVEEKKEVLVEKDSKQSENTVKADSKVEVKKSDDTSISTNEDVKKSNSTRKEQNKIADEKRNDNKKPEESVKPNETAQTKSTDPKADTSSKTTLQVPSSQNKRITPPLGKTSKSKITHDDSITNKMQTSRNSLESLCTASKLLDLETPRKIETEICVPPTPRFFATPAHSLKKTYVPKADVIIKDLVETPDFPITPCIVVTPKAVEEDSVKRPSPYYEPSEEIMKEVNDKIKSQETTTTTASKKNVVELQEHEVVEITEFGIVEKNVQPEDKQEQASKDNLKDDSKDISNDTSNDTSKDTSKASVDAEEVNTSGSSSSDSGEESSDGSSSSSSSSSANSSSNSLKGSSSESSPRKPIPDTRDVIRKHQIEFDDVKMDSPLALIQSLSDISQEEITDIETKLKDDSSSRKILSTTKKLPHENPKETPAKDESAETITSDMSSVSEIELIRDSTSNTTPKVSAALTVSSQSPSTPEVSTTQPFVTNKNLNAKPEESTKPKIIRIEKIAPTDGMAIQVSKLLQSEVARVPISVIHQQASSNSDAKLGNALEEKRLRVMAKFKEKMNAKPVVQLKKQVDGKQKKAIGEQKISSTTENFRNKSRSRSRSRSSEQSRTVVVEKVDVKREEKVVVKEEKTTVRRSSRALQKADEADSKESKTTQNRSSPRKKTEPRSEQGSKEFDTESNRKNKDKEAKTSNVRATVSTTTVLPVENSKGISKAKVDLVRRDLFSDEENEPRTTRSQSTRRSTTVLESQKSSDENTSNDNSKLLECLQLIPANKSDIENQNLSPRNEKDEPETNGRNHLDMKVKYDESIPIKKRRRNYSNCELQNEYVLQIEAEDDVVLKVTSYEEMFQIDPKSKKRVPSPKKSPTRICKKKKSKDADVVEFVSSSPLVTSSSKNDEERKKRPYKRKTLTLVEDTKVDSKSNPLSLLKRVKIEDFLKSVHEKEK